MRRRPLSVIAAAGTALTLTVLPVLVATSTASAATTYGANWQMNERGGKMLDSSGNKNNSLRIGPGITRDGRAYHFTGLGSIIVKTSSTLQPGSRSFQVAASVHLNATGDQNFVQKGGLSETLGQWKIEISGTHAHCRIAGTTGVASIWFWGVGKAMEKGYHTFTCAKYPDHVTATFDKQTKTQVIAVGTVTTPRNVTIGGKGPNCGTDCDYLNGDIDWATLTYF
jgi:hypothetical protein